MSAQGLLRFTQDGYTMFWCPVCDEPHAVVVGKWTWNGDAERPTFSPSVLVTGRDKRCHSFVRDGMIEFLPDCTHTSAGKTMPLGAWPNCKARFYADRTGIDVFIRTLATGPTVVCRIIKKQIKSWLSLIEKDKP